MPIFGLNMRSLIRAGLRMGYTFGVILDHPFNVFRVTRNGAGFVFRTWPGLITFRKRQDSNALIDKATQKSLLTEAGLPVPRLLGVVSRAEQLRDLHMTFPCVVKPCLGSYSRRVVTHIDTPSKLRRALALSTERSTRALVEQHVDGAHYRVLCVGGRFAGCVERRPPQVVGDGLRTIAELVEQRNREPGREGRDPLDTLLHPIRLDSDSAALLRLQGCAHDTVLPAGATVRLSRLITGRVGADFIDVSGRIHQETVALCERFASRHHLFMAGFDLITPRIGVSVREVGAVNEVNVREVDITCIEHCNIGQRRPVSRYIWERVAFDDVAAPSCPPY